MLNTSTAQAHQAPDLSYSADAETTLPVRPDHERGVAAWLEAFACLECDRAVLLRGIADSVTFNPDAGREFLALAEQFHGLNRITAEDLREFNEQVQALLLQSPFLGREGPSATVPKSSGPRSIAVGEELRGRYRIKGILGRGGMGIVYGAIDQYRLNDAAGGQRVALKVLKTESVQRPQLLAELRGEFQRLQALSHPNIVRVHDFDRDGELIFFTMEHLSGAALSRVLDMRNAVALLRAHALCIIRQAGAAVAYAHSRGIVHGDLSPRNIFITDEGEIRVLDFGASRRLRPDTPAAELEDPLRIAVATPSYASCELLAGRLADRRDDIYSLACISYVLLTGKHPFHGQTALVARTRRLTPRRPAGLTVRQWRALKAGLQVDRTRRPDDMQAWLADLNATSPPMNLPPLSAVTGARQPQKRIRPWMTAGVIVLIAGTIGWALVHGDLIPRGASGLGTTATRSESPAKGLTHQTALPGTAATAGPATPQPAVSPVPVIASPEDTTARTAPVAALPASPPAAPTLARIELAADTLDISPLQPVASVIVHRRRNYHRSVSFSWWTEAGTAKPGLDFIPVKARTSYIPAGDNEARLSVPIVADPRRKTSKTFYVLVGDPSDDAALGPRTTTLVTIPAVQ